ncbi:hypothetical protein [Aestuariimicrobium sp. Y1814]|uniref:hypothetical protein n=1 Tax=Aestuariimicrobium sp. Y1814 TaxID=3418742 RepID=UPI003DA7612D
MPIQRVQSGPIPRYFGALNAAQTNAARNVIAQLVYPDIFRGARTLHTVQPIRLDLQGQIPGPPQQANIQAQVNGVQGNSTVAHVLVDWSVANNDPANQLGVERAVRAALRSSLADGHTWLVSGSI